MLGAGSGVFLLFYVRPEEQARVRSEPADLMYVPFFFEDSGTRVIHYTPEEYEPPENQAAKEREDAE